MKRICSICISLLPIASCGEKETPAKSKTMSSLSDRAAAAAENVEPDLKEQLKAKGLKFGSPVFIRAFKEERLLEFFIQNHATRKFELFKTYPIAAASGSLGPKLAEGDWQVPEGFYVVPPDAMNPNSQFHLSFNIGYPNEIDRSKGRTGTAIMIHGNAVSVGCLAMTDEKIEEIYTLCDAAHKEGQAFFRVHIFPFRMTSERMQAAAGSEWLEFWKNLKEGYDLFEKNRVPPNANVNIKGDHYTFD
jgi:murein L,D-transpeptidase YafK